MSDREKHDQGQSHVGTFLGEVPIQTLTNHLNSPSVDKAIREAFQQLLDMPDEELAQALASQELGPLGALMHETGTTDRLYHEALKEENEALRNQVASFRKEGNMLIENAYNSWAEAEVLKGRVAQLEAENKELTLALEQAKKGAANE